jgi:hypothetical protein
MARVIGRLAKIGIGVESTRGTTVAPDYWVPVTEMDFDDKVEYTDNDSGLGRLEEKNAADIVKRWGEGSYSGKIFDVSVGAELTALFGQAPVSTERGSSDVFDHAWSLAQNNQHKSLTVGYKDAQEDLRYAMAMVSGWNLELEVDNYARREIQLISKKSADATNSPAYTEEYEFLPKHIVIKQADDLTGLGAAAALKVRSASLEITKNAEASYVFGSTDPDDINNKQFAVSGSIELFYDDTTMRDQVLAGVNKALRIEATNTDVDLGSGHNPALRFDLAKVKFGEQERGNDNNDLMTMTINFEALFSIADTSMITAQLTNADAGTNYA